MREQINTIRAALYDWDQRDQALTALAQLEAMAGEPVAWMYRWKGRTTSEQVTRARWPESDLWIEVPLYEAAPVAQQARADLEAEVARLREELATVRGEALEPATNKSHRCIKCLYAYSPEDDESEDCPSCGHDGSELKETP